MVIRKTDHGPSVNHQLVLTFQVVRELPSAYVLQVRAISVDLKANSNGGTNIRKVQIPFAILEIIDFIFRMKVAEVIK
ncbi:hypothetical protein [Neobacillus cucumis]|uniref:hypothetical protein n=1 Tax=Neobacillus cucumis TaxID=1740721 RepID=UPI0035F4CB84